MQEQGHTLITKNLSDLLGGKKLFTLKMNKFITIKTLDQKEFSPLAFSFKPFLLKNSNLIERPLSTKKIKINFKNYHVRKKQEELAKEKKQAELEKRREELYKKKRQERLKKRQELLKQKGSAAQGTNALKTTNDTKNK